MKKREILKVLFLNLAVCFFAVSLISATDLNLKVTGNINGYSSDLWLKDNANADSDIDAYDMLAPSSPSNYSTFSSSSSGQSLSIDSWNFNDNTRIFNLTFSITNPQTGTFNISWNSSAIDTSEYVVVTNPCKYPLSEPTFFFFGKVFSDSPNKFLVVQIF